mmetsp:Transcript_728/g.1555  ORF Transcript_728/g.1555 Transcript_728/m.1555 type:complete len:348 (-) Transcript_728:364-1407(-)
MDGQMPDTIIQSGGSATGDSPKRRTAKDVPRQSIQFLTTRFGRMQISCILLGQKLINNGICENTSNSNGTSEQLHGIQTLSQNDGHSHNDDDTLGSIGHRLRHGSGLLESHGGELIVSIKPKSRRDEVGRDDGVGLEHLDELSQFGSLPPEDEGNAHEESENGGECKLISHAAHAVFQSLGLHELLVFVSLEGGEEVGDAGADEGGDGEVEFLDGGEDDSSDDDGEAEPFGFGDGFVVDELGEDGGEGGLGGLDDLSEGDGSGGEGEDGGGVGAHEAERDGEHLDDVVEGDGGFGAGVGGEPEEDSVDSADGELEGGDGHGESGRSSSGLKCQLVGNVVVVVSNIPE